MRSGKNQLRKHSATLLAARHKPRAIACCAEGATKYKANWREVLKQATIQLPARQQQGEELQPNPLRDQPVPQDFVEAQMRRVIDTRRYASWAPSTWGATHGLRQVPDAWALSTADWEALGNAARGESPNTAAQLRVTSFSKRGGAPLDSANKFVGMSGSRAARRKAGPSGAPATPAAPLAVPAQSAAGKASHTADAWMREAHLACVYARTQRPSSAAKLRETAELLQHVAPAALCGEVLEVRALRAATRLLGAACCSAVLTPHEFLQALGKGVGCHVALRDAVRASPKAQVRLQILFQRCIEQPETMRRGVSLALCASAQARLGYVHVPFWVHFVTNDCTDALGPRATVVVLLVYLTLSKKYKVALEDAALFDALAVRAVRVAKAMSPGDVRGVASAAAQLHGRPHGRQLRLALARALKVLPAEEAEAVRQALERSGDALAHDIFARVLAAVQGAADATGQTDA
jgi:hypothetical protein